ncbi:MAG: hypothetical protein A2X78_03080 [Gammaproteobacteria bacterium GWE2_37_16]|nr:MAG: hypothetical protein A2X78_03080 [Gammaproteobacteria bacterium GWE2_37_16]
MIPQNKLSKNGIASLASDCLEQYISEMGWRKPEDVFLDITCMYESVIYPQKDISLITSCDLGTHEGQKVLGKTILDDKVILIDKSINKDSKDPRYTFTLAHEIGHGLAHTGQNINLFRCTDETIYKKQPSLYEFQANFFAENLIMPAGLVRYWFKTYYGTDRSFRYRGACWYSIGNENIYIKSLAHLGWYLARPLTLCFSNISKESLAYRMLKLKIILNETKESIFDGMKEGFAGVKLLNNLGGNTLNALKI